LEVVSLESLWEEEKSHERGDSGFVEKLDSVSPRSLVR
jgi:hypothetical protein